MVLEADLHFERMNIKERIFIEDLLKDEYDLVELPTTEEIKYEIEELKNPNYVLIDPE